VVFVNIKGNFGKLLNTNGSKNARIWPESHWIQTLGDSDSHAGSQRDFFRHS
jgi:hypothetical protein